MMIAVTIMTATNTNLIPLRVSGGDYYFEEIDEEKVYF